MLFRSVIGLTPAAAATSASVVLPVARVRALRDILVFTLILVAGVGFRIALSNADVDGARVCHGLRPGPAAR